MYPKSSTFESNPPAQEQQLKKSVVLSTPSSNHSFTTVNIVTRSPTICQEHADDTFDEEFYAQNWIFKLNKPRPLDKMSGLAPIWVGLKKQK